MIVAPMPPSAASPPAQNRIEGIRAGSHDTFSRIVFDLNGDASYQVTVTEENVITVSFSNCTLSDGAKGKRYSDALIKKITCKETPEKKVVADIMLDGHRRSFSHNALTRPPRVVLDIANVRDRSGDQQVAPGGGSHKDTEVVGMTPLAAKTPPAGEEPGNEDEDRAETAEPAKAETKETLLVSTGHAQEDLLVTSTTTVRSDPPREQKEEEANPEAKRTYRSALELFDQKRYRKALAMLRYFMDNYPRSQLAGAVSFLIGDCYYQLAEENILTSYQPAIDAFQLALALYSESEGVDRGYFKLANCYREMGCHFEADENYKLLLETHPGSNYIPEANFWMAENLYQEEEFERARDRFQHYLVKYPQGAFVGKASFRAADCLVGMKEYGKALQSYEELMGQWPVYSGLCPETLYSMGITYLENGNYQRAQSILFTALNVFPEQEYNHILLTKIGDSYQMEGKVEEALKVYSQNNVH
jgi:TolA-binding protein